MTSVSIGWAHPGEVNSDFAESVMKLLTIDAAREPGDRRVMTEGGGLIPIRSGPRIAAARDRIVRDFLAHGGEWLWMLDTDMTFDAMTLEILLAVADPEERPVVGGLCFGGGRGIVFPTMYEIVDPKENDDIPVKVITEWPEGAVVQVDATGAACLLMHRSLLEAMGERFPEPFPWFHESVYKQHPFGEDWTFCLKVGQMGKPIYVATAAKTGHMKTFELNEEAWKAGGIQINAVRPIKSVVQEDGTEETASGLTVVHGNLKPNLNRQQRRALARAGG